MKLTAYVNGHGLDNLSYNREIADPDLLVVFKDDNVG
jgi:hypothetical protein